MAASPAGGLCSASREHEGGPALLLLGAGGLGAVLSGPTPAGLGDASHGAGALAALAGLPENVLYNGAVYWKNDTFVALGGSTTEVAVFEITLATDCLSVTGVANASLPSAPYGGWQTMYPREGGRGAIVIGNGCSGGLRPVAVMDSGKSAGDAVITSVPCAGPGRALSQPSRKMAHSRNPGPMLAVSLADATGVDGTADELWAMAQPDSTGHIQVALLRPNLTSPETPAAVVGRAVPIMLNTSGAMPLPLLSYGEFMGDGRGEIVVSLSGMSGVQSATLAWNGTDITLEGPAGGTTADGSRGWLSQIAAPWVASGRDTQLVGVRAPPTKPESVAFDVNVVVLGQSRRLLSRHALLKGVRSQFSFDGPTKPATAAEVNAAILSTVAATNTNAYSFNLCDKHTPAHSCDDRERTGYATFVDFLEASKDIGLRLSVTLYPPSEAVDDNCQIPCDSNRTAWNETALFDAKLGYLDYGAWAENIGRLTAQYPHLVSMTIDDFSHNLSPAGPDRRGVYFSPAFVATVTRRLRAHSPRFTLVPVVYFFNGGTETFGGAIDLPMTLDAPLFYFRNELEGAGPCADPSCPWGPRAPANVSDRHGGCLAGECATGTARNAPQEIERVATYLPAGRKMHVGFYATGHSSLGDPTARYVYEIMPAILTQPSVAGVNVYCAWAPANTSDCSALSAVGAHGDKGCAVKLAFDEAAASGFGATLGGRVGSGGSKLRLPSAAAL